ncbi:1-acyl-sn-glycerol-3-phosphate acyltransferase [Cyanobacterium stanieri LEGE 03274]|uniref:1-acyl-sn-glycerol-3-phosphate acyltransferase n=1 Tax=Cyanobacterium stanieri LEGE 03274 TaxID=1828756 RepID=A0ABR9V0V1_9CHRO|nr:lysophospholipid acyltransferase family protein [Cyanobacterium stanieri]MBE9221518.1 1-acyl-sn-glycerol-3-phosphate acyltransferase [Cyanobacterium stanieri LEGE 03274]
MISEQKQTHSPSHNHSSQITSEIAPWLSKIAYFLGKTTILPLFFKNITITGQENIPRNGAVIVAPTHRSRWDALVVPYAVGRLSSGRDLHFMVSANEMKGIQGWFIRRLGGFPVNTEHPGIESLNHSFELLSQGEMVVIFPEGGIFRTQEVQSLKRGVAKIALDTEEVKPEVQIKLLPVRVSYDQEIPRKGASVTINIGKPLIVKDYHISSQNPRRNSINLTQSLEEALKEL